MQVSYICQVTSTSFSSYFSCPLINRLYVYNYASEKHGLKKVFIATDDCEFTTKVVDDLLSSRNNLEVHTTCSTEKKRVGFNARKWHSEKHHDCASVYDVLFSIEALAKG